MSGASGVLGDSDRLLRVGYVACATMVVGAIAPWISFQGEEVLGINDPAGVSSAVADLLFVGSDGWLILALAGMSIAVLWSWDNFASREKLNGLMVIAALALAIVGYDLIDIYSFDVPTGPGQALEGPSAGWGLIAAAIGSIGLLACSIRLAVLNPA